MARRSNKTAHVLNLIAGHDAAKENTDTADATTPDSAATSTEAGHSPAPQTPAAPAAATQNISVIDTTEEDPVADLIQQNLSHEFLAPETDAEPTSASKPISESQPASESVLQVESAPVAEPIQETESIPAAEPIPTDTETIAVSAPEPVSTPKNASESEPATALEPASEPKTTTASESSFVPESSSASNSISEQVVSVTEPISEPDVISHSEPAAEPKAATPDPEPDFVRLNVMEGIVKDKIIYFMRQFDVCTCDRCVNDTIALTMNGLLPKYIVTTRAAVDPLMSYYTNRLISDVTVEATKACIIVKDNPRH